MIGPARLGLGRGSSGNGARGESGGRFNHYTIYVAAALSQSRTNEFRFTSWSRLKRNQQQAVVRMDKLPKTAGSRPRGRDPEHVEQAFSSPRSGRRAAR